MGAIDAFEKENAGKICSQRVIPQITGLNTGHCTDYRYKMEPTGIVY